MWRPISIAPYDRDIELAVIDAEGTHALVFPCRRNVTGSAQFRGARIAAGLQADRTVNRAPGAAASPPRLKAVPSITALFFK